MSKKNSSKTAKKISASKKNIKTFPKKNKKKEEIEEFEESDSLEGTDFEEEVEEKNEIERLIKGEKETKNNIIDKEKLDNTVNKNINEKVKEEPEKTKSLVKKTRKETIMDSILDAYKQLETPENEMMTAAQLKATKINILEKKLADLTEKIVQKIAIGGNVPIETSKQLQLPEIGISNELATNALFNVNIIMCKFVENLAETGRQNDTTKKYIPDINGLCERLLKPEKEKQLKECLKSIIDTHGEKIKPFLSPLGIYAMFMITTASEQVTENLSKNSNQLIT